MLDLSDPGVWMVACLVVGLAFGLVVAVTR